MRHVTDGELHAFLDGGLDLLPDGRGDEVRDHISGCSVCQERLQDEEGVRSKAEDILGGASLGDLKLPSLEEIRERASIPGPEAMDDQDESRGMLRHRGPQRSLPLAWAATIVLALGVGWMGGQVWSALPSPGPEEQSGPPILEPGPSAARFSGVEMEAEKAVTDPAGSRGGGEAPALEASVGGDARLSEALGARDESDVLAGRRDASPRATPPAAVTLEASRISTDEGNLSLSEDPPPHSLGTSLALPGLKVVSIEWEERVSGEKALLIRQLLSPADTIELRYLGLLLGSDPESREGEPVLSKEESGRGRLYANILEASLKPGWHQVVMEKGRGLLVARAPMSEADLKALLKALR